MLDTVPHLVSQAQDWSTAPRQRMVRDQIEARGIRDPRILNAMRELPRHLFVPEAIQRRAYDDGPLAIGHGQTISQPYIVASMTDLLALRREHKVLEIGTGSGYQAAVLAKLAGYVWSIEIVRPLALQAAALLSSLGLTNVAFRTGDGYAGWPEHAPFDRIILTAAPPEIPQALIDQLKPGGKLVAPVGVEFQELVVIEKDAAGRTRKTVQYPVVFVPMVKGAPDRK